MNDNTHITDPADRTDPATARPRRLRTALVAAAVSGGALLGAAQLGGAVSALTDDGDAPADATDATDVTAAECHELREERREERRQEREEHAEELAGILGIDAETLHEQLRSGETLASIATANGVDVQQIVDHIVAERTASIAERVADGVIDQERADEILEGLEDRVTEMVNEGRPERGPGHGGPRGDGGPFGEPPADVEG